MKEKLISVIIPAYNEEKYILKTITAILQWPIKIHDVIVVDDGSSDSTYEILEEINKKYEVLKIIRLHENSGKGNALMEGIKEARGNIYFFLDADLGESAIHAVKLLDPIFNKKCDMTIAILPKSTKKAGVGLVKNLAKKGILFLTGRQVREPLSGQRAIKKEIIEEIPIFAEGFGIEVGLTIDVLRQGYRIEEIEIPLKHRETGRSIRDIVHRGIEFFHVSRALYRKWRYL